MRQFRTAKDVVTSLPGYTRTALHELPGLARWLSVEHVAFKDESSRFGLSAFKGVGGVYAVCRLLQAQVSARTGNRCPSAAELIRGEYTQVARELTVACATTGNHGRSVARAAQIFGCRCVIYVPVNTSAGRIEALRTLGAIVTQTNGNYDQAVQQAETDARGKGWYIISDTAYDGHESTPRDVMHGYRVIVDEIVEQLGATPPTHVFVQTGVGAIAAAFCSHFWELWGSQRPRFIVVESRVADCMMRSARLGRPISVEGPLDTRMYGLAAGKPSVLAWKILSRGTNDFVAIDDEASFTAMRLLAQGVAGDPRIVAGEAGAAGLGALIATRGSEERRCVLGLNTGSRVLLIGTEGATDPESYLAIIANGVESDQVNDPFRSSDPH
jgi:diaminopropionate ammonia-lyase